MKEISTENIEKFLQEHYQIENVGDLFQGASSDPKALVEVVKEFTHLVYDEDRNLLLLDHPVFSSVYLAYENHSPFAVRSEKHLLTYLKDLRAVTEHDIMKQQRIINLKRIQDWRGKRLDRDL